MAKIKIGLRGLTPAQKLEKAKSIGKKAAAHPALDSGRIPISELAKAANMLEKAITMAEFGDKRAIAARTLCEKQVDLVIRNMGSSIEQASGHDRAVIEQCGFEVRSTNNRSAPLDAPHALDVKRLETPGSVALKWQPVPNSKSYLVQTSNKAPNSKTNWQTSGYSTRSRCTLDALKIGTTYWFRVMAIGAKGIGPPSIIASIMAA